MTQTQELACAQSRDNQNHSLALMAGPWCNEAESMWLWGCWQHPVLLHGVHHRIKWRSAEMRDGRESRQGQERDTVSETLASVVLPLGWASQAHKPMHSPLTWARLSWWLLLAKGFVVTIDPPLETFSTFTSLTKPLSKWLPISILRFYLFPSLGTRFPTLYAGHFS